MDQVRSAIGNWITREPVASLWLVLAAAVFFGVTFVRSRGQDNRAGVWLRCLVESLAQTLALVALLGVTYFLLSSNFSAFNKIYSSFITSGSLSNRAWQLWRDRYGGTVVQRDLAVTQYVTLETEEVIQPADPSGPLLYHIVKREEPVALNSIVGFRGRVTIDQVDLEHQADIFTGYTLTAHYEYDIVNSTETETRVEFRFPLSRDTPHFEGILVKENGEEVPYWSNTSGEIRWETHLAAGQESLVSIEYATYGMDGFAFIIPAPREVLEFKLVVATDGNAGPYTYPEDSGIRVETGTEAPYRIFTWTIERAIMSPSLSIGLPQYWPYAPYQEMISFLPYAGRAALLFLSLAMLTTLICNAPVSLRQAALLAFLFTIPFLILMSGYLPYPTAIGFAKFADYQVKMIPVISLLPLALAFFSFRKLPRLPLVLTLVLMALFMGGYSFIGLILDEQKRNVVEGVVQVGMIAYIFLLTLFVRVRGMQHSKH